jgi:hypothetical protein
MRRRLLLAAAIVLAVAGGVAGWFLGDAVTGAETETLTTTATTTATEATPAPGLPTAVEETRAALLAAAESGDYEALRPLLPTTGFEYTFGGTVPGGPIAYWKQVERETDDRPLETLALILRMPYTLSRGYYVWPFAYDVASANDLSAHERELLAPLGGLDTLFFEGTGYLGWRTGIDPNGVWTFFVAGD